MRCSIKQTTIMAKLYSKKKVEAPKMEPKSETISFLLNYSKALTIVKTEKITIDIVKN